MSVVTMKKVKKHSFRKFGRRLPVNRLFLGTKSLQQGSDGVSDTDSGTEIRAIARQKDAALRC